MSRAKVTQSGLNRVNLISIFNGVWTHVSYRRNFAKVKENHSTK